MLVYVFKTRRGHRELAREKLDRLVHPDAVWSQADLPAQHWELLLL